jgi:hypothetical protein
MEGTCLFSAIAGNQKIDSDSGIISGVSVITAGECAGKHAGTWIDHNTISSLLSIASGFKDGVKVKLSQSEEHDGSVGQIIGTLKGFRIDGNQLRADLHLLKSDENYGKILEMSSKMPEAFGLSVAVDKNYEKQGDKHFLRPTDIYSVDLVEQPAANRGLFSAKPMNDIKLAADGKTHEKDCGCKACMSAKEKSELSAMIAEQVALAIKGIAAPDVTALTAKLTEHETQLSAFKASTDASALSSKKAEIAGLVADATREGKVVPLTDEQLSKMEIPVIKEMFSKLTKGQVKLAGTRKIEPPKSADGKVITFETADARAEFCRSKQAEGAAQLTAQFLADTTLGLSRN